ncbi:F-box/FBD/LRR-repeat protein At5g53840-like [Oryza brachyantha]|uniref:F-box/FBD/LRR-repeat protein At5g53840-like n=1 Tax=Oryza brachyantha TaxID=4533 RepID=UPI001ADB6D61|nr:F-box/FBD/LRR-repeat protein At5g53840-like [Oryza brachyantha]
MEAPDPPPATRKRGRAEADDQPEEAAPNDLLPPPPAARGERRARSEGGEELEGEEDCIGRLPDALLGAIISLLPTKDGGRTQALATRWRPLWRTAPLNLDHADLAPAADGEALSGLVSRIILAHAGPGRRFCVPAQLLHDGADTVEEWLRSPALNNLQELEFTVPGEAFYAGVLNPPPPSTFRFSATLRVAVVSQCRLPDTTALTLQFPVLTLLALQQVYISEASLDSILAGCPAMEGLLLKGCFGFRCLRINSSTIRSVAFHSPCCGGRCAGEEGHHLEEVVIQDAPLLERLLHVERSIGLGVRVTVMAAPKLETLGVLDDLDGLYSGFDFGTVVFKGFDMITFTTPVSTLKILSLMIDILSLDKVIDLMKCFPCLEKLYITPMEYGETNSWRRKHGRTVRSLDMRLKTIVLDDYRGTKSQINFATFFIWNARMLETITFMGGLHNSNVNFVAEQQRLLQLEKRASRDAKICFRSNQCAYDMVHIKKVHDLSLADPFKCSC